MELSSWPRERRIELVLDLWRISSDGIGAAGPSSGTHGMRVMVRPIPCDFDGLVLWPRHGVSPNPTAVAVAVAIDGRFLWTETVRRPTIQLRVEPEPWKNEQHTARKDVAPHLVVIGIAIAGSHRRRTSVSACARQDSNLRPMAPEATPAATTLDYRRPRTAAAMRVSGRQGGRRPHGCVAIIPDV
jgi:hypothetical protein